MTEVIDVDAYEEDMDDLVRREEDEAQQQPREPLPRSSAIRSSSSPLPSSQSEPPLPSLEADDGGGGFIVEEEDSRREAELEEKYADDSGSAEPSSNKRKRDFVSLDDDSEPDVDALAELDAQIAQHRNDKQRQPPLPQLSKDVRACSECGNLAYNVPFFTAFGIAVCKECQAHDPMSYSLVTKTTARTLHLLTDSELQSLPFLLRPNPSRGSFANMKLYRLCDVTRLSIQRWGSEAGVEQERRRREVERLEKEVEKRRKSRREMEKERRVREYRLDKQLEQGHKHRFVDEPRTGKQKCNECGFTIDFEVL